MKEQQFFVGQKAFIKRRDEILVLICPNKGLDFPGGKIQEGEKDVVESLKREVKEETGLEIEIGKPFVTWVNEYPAHHQFSGKKLFLVAYECKYISGEVSLSDEHDKFSWVNKDNCKEVDDGTSWFDILNKYFTKQ